MEGNVTQIKSRIRIDVDEMVKNIYVKNSIFGILIHIVLKLVNI